MAKPNYRQQKRQKELSRKSRQAERLQRRLGKLEGDDNPVDPMAESPAVDVGVPGTTPPALPVPTPKATP